MIEEEIAKDNQKAENLKEDNRTITFVTNNMYEFLLKGHQFRKTTLFK